MSGSGSGCSTRSDRYSTRVFFLFVSLSREGKGEEEPASVTLPLLALPFLSVFVSFFLSSSLAGFLFLGAGLGSGSLAGGSTSLPRQPSLESGEWRVDAAPLS